MSDDLNRFATCLQLSLAASLRSIPNKGVVVEALSLQHISVLIYFAEDVEKAHSAKEWTERVLRSKGFEIGGIAQDYISVAYSVSCTERVMQSFLRRE